MTWDAKTRLGTCWEPIPWQHILPPLPGEPRMMRKVEEPDRLIHQKASMTQIVGIVAQDAICVASDTQFTMGGNSGYKTEGNSKLHTINFKNCQALVAICGDVEAAERTVSILKSSAQEREVNNPDVVINEVRKAALVFRREMVEYHGLSEAENFEECNQLFNNADFDLVVAYYFDSKPFLYKFDFGKGFQSQHLKYVVAGSGSEVATFFLGQFLTEKPQFEWGVTLILEAVERIKMHDSSCGGSVEFCMVGPQNNTPSLVLEFKKAELVGEILRRLAEFRPEHTKWYKNELHSILKAAMDTMDSEKETKTNPPLDTPNYLG